jgi:hypothetical protein
MQLVQADQHGQKFIAAALQKPELLTLFATAYRSSGRAMTSFRLAIQQPDAPEIGLKVKNLHGLPRWAVDKILKSATARSSIRAAH